MIYNDGNSELQIRLHIAEMLKDKIEQDNYIELCERAFIFVTNGIDLPKVKKNPLEEAVDMFAKSMKPISLSKNSLDELMKELSGESLSKSQRDELKDLAGRYYGYCLTHKGHLCYICGYSDEFNCLIAGTYDDCDNADTLGHTDYVNKVEYRGYFYIPRNTFNKN